MEADAIVKNAEIKGRVRAAFVFMLVTLFASQFISMILPSVPAQICQILCMIIGMLIALTGRSKPEKGTLMAEANRMTGRSFVVTLGAFMAAKLLSTGAAAALMLLFADESAAEALDGIATVEDDLLMSFLFLGIATPICEEAVFRGCVGNGFKKHGIRFAMIMSSLLFAMYHCNLFQLISAFLPGIVLFYVAMNYSIKWSVLFHFINNGVLSIGSLALKNAFPDSFAAGCVEYVIEGALLIAALCLMKKDAAVEKVKAFLSAPENEKGAYKAAAGNVWFILMAFIMAIVTAGLFLMIGGGMADYLAAG